MSNSQLYKGSLNTIILKLLEENGRMYGYEITQRVKQLTNDELVINEGALYPALHKLEAEGALTVSIEPFGNRMRKYYAITQVGKQVTIDRIAEFEAFIANMAILLNPKLAH